MSSAKHYARKAHDFITTHHRLISILVLALSLIALVGSSVYVGYKSGVIHTNNHDNLIDNYMFESAETFEGALFPAAHTFLLKWPFFAVSAQFSNTYEVYVVGTILMYMVTILGFLLVVYLIAKKNLYITAIAAALLTNILLLTPPQPVDGTLLPLNMAMITTRNIEFLFLFGFMYLALKSTKILSWRFILSIAVLTLLGATDKFYLMITLIAAVLYLLYVYSPLGSKLENKSRAWLPLLAGLISYVAANIILIAINYLNITNVPGPTNTAPFALVSSVWMMLEATAGGIQATVANFGANIFGKSLGLGLLPLLINGLCLIAAIVSAYLLFIKDKVVSDKSIKNSVEYRFTLWLVLTYVAAFILFIASDHGYLIDGRYLTGALFAGVASISLLLTVIKVNYKNSILLLIAVLLLIASPIHLLVARANYARAQDSIQAAIGDRTTQAANILKENDVEVFAGDYWFVSPVRLKTDNTIIPVLMSTEVCDTANSFLTSKAWYAPSPTVKTSALYILRDANKETNTYNHGCTIDYLNNRYGEPTAEYIIREDEEGLPVDIIRIYPYDIREKIATP